MFLPPNLPQVTAFLARSCWQGSLGAVSCRLQPSWLLRSNKQQQGRKQASRDSEEVALNFKRVLTEGVRSNERQLHSFQKSYRMWQGRHVWGSNIRKVKNWFLDVLTTSCPWDFKTTLEQKWEVLWRRAEFFLHSAKGKPQNTTIYLEKISLQHILDSDIQVWEQLDPKIWSTLHDSGRKKSLRGSVMEAQVYWLLAAPPHWPVLLPQVLEQSFKNRTWTVFWMLYHLCGWTSLLIHWWLCGKFMILSIWQAYDHSHYNSWKVTFMAKLWTGKIPLCIPACDQGPPETGKIRKWLCRHRGKNLLGPPWELGQLKPGRRRQLPTKPSKDGLGFYGVFVLQLLDLLSWQIVSLMWKSQLNHSRM